MRKHSTTTFKSLVSKYQYFIFDCDGVLWYGNTQIGQAAKNLEYLQSIGKKVFFVTNNGAISRKNLARKIISDSFGFTDCNVDQLYTGSSLAALHLQVNRPDVKKVQYIGHESLAEELEAHGLIVEPIESKQSGEQELNYLDYLDDMELDPFVGAIVCGNDTAITHHKYCVASKYLQNGRLWV